MPQTINYSQFLFIQLLCVMNTTFSELEYDIQFPAGIMLYEIYDNSSYNNPEKGEYECMEEYIKAYTPEIDDSLTKF